jgi:hypothetical protein
MRYILSLALLLSACTRANPDAIGGNGGGAGSGGGGAAGSGGGGAGGSGGANGGADLAMSMPADMAHPPDMTSLEGVECGNSVCKGQDCCINNNGEQCTSQQQCSGGSHPTLWGCDGPEDCPGASNGTHEQCCANTSGSACDPSCAGVGGLTPMCHTVKDCPDGAGYISCCPIKALPQYSLCAKTACPP